MSSMTDPGVINTHVGRRHALCCECGHVRSVSANYGGGKITSNNVKVPAENFSQTADEWGSPQDLQMLRCDNCGRKTRHATCSEPERAIPPRTEAVDRSRTALDWFNQWFPDWRVHLVYSIGDDAAAERFYRGERQVEIAITGKGDLPLDLSLRVLHAAAHLALDHLGDSAAFSPDQEDEAESLALGWLDRIVENLAHNCHA